MNMPAIAPPRSQADLMIEIRELYSHIRNLREAQPNWTPADAKRGAATIENLNQRIFRLEQEL